MKKHKLQNTKLIFNKNIISKLQETTVKAGLQPNTPATLCYVSCEIKCIKKRTSDLGCSCECDEN